MFGPSGSRRQGRRSTRNLDTEMTTYLVKNGEDTNMRIALRTLIHTLSTFDDGMMSLLQSETGGIFTASDRQRIASIGAFTIDKAGFRQREIRITRTSLYNTVNFLDSLHAKILREWEGTGLKQTLYTMLIQFQTDIETELNKIVTEHAYTVPVPSNEMRQLQDEAGIVKKSIERQYNDITGLYEGYISGATFFINNIEQAINRYDIINKEMAKIHRYVDGQL